jgi:hypothetical protein
MKDYSPLQKAISLLMIVVLLMQFNGCVSSKVIKSNSDIPVTGGYYYIIHDRHNNYITGRIKISDGILSGFIDTDEQAYAGSKVHIYLMAGSIMKIDNGIATVPLDTIAKVRIVKDSTGKTILLTAGSVFVLLMLLAAASFSGQYQIGGH